MRASLTPLISAALATALIGCSGQSPLTTAHADGAVRAEGNRFVAWDAQRSEWLTPDAFWRRYAERKGGYTFGPSRSYPPYASVKEGDTLLIQTDHGDCLMEFFHSRWRRANDVRRWDDAFNNYGGCAQVFE